RLILHPLQKWEIFGATIASIIIFAVLFFKYFRYLLSDSETLALLTLNPKHMIIDSPLIVVTLVVLLSLTIFIIFNRFYLVFFPV
ncbi:unnamed protein product, partial [marine sediment metagenome]